MDLILVSACLLGQPVRYHGGDAVCQHSILQRWIDEKRVVAVCPEMAGGLPTPRPAAEILNAGAGGGTYVLQHRTQVVETSGRDVTHAFISGAEQALAVVKKKKIRLAILKEGSPSCGVNYTYDGTFTGARVATQGVTAALLQQHDIQIFSEFQLEQAAAYLAQLEANRLQAGGVI